MNTCPIGTIPELGSRTTPLVRAARSRIVLEVFRLMERSVFMLCSLFIHNASFSQTLVSTGGGSGDVPGGSVSWSVGEPIIGTGTLPGGIITQGFQQPQGGGPENDDCADAIMITCGSATNGTTIGALPETLGAFTGNTQDAPSVWYTFVGSNSGDPGAAPGSPGDQVTLSTCNDGGLTAGSADYDSKLDVYTGTCNALSWVGGNDDGGGCADYSSLFGFPTIVGTTYYVRVYGFTTDSYGDFVLAMECAPPCIPVPFNDGCAAPEELVITPFESPSYVDGTTDCATVENFYPSCDPFGEIKGVWYAFTTDESGQATVRLEGITATDLNITLYSVAPCDGPPVEVNCNSVLTLPFDFALNTQPNTAYRLLVHSSTASSGSFTIAVTLDEPPPLNDECAGAIPLTTGYSCVAVTAGSVSGAQQSLAAITCPPFTSPAALDVWYSF
ncbi:MAG: hypothetical protein KDB84_12105, partial [Flavobacteriales bacterium]|nr:hypothetical protein [Flavobacteriales bacterium]